MDGHRKRVVAAIGGSMLAFIVGVVVGGAAGGGSNSAAPPTPTKTIRVTAPPRTVSAPAVTVTAKATQQPKASKPPTASVTIPGSAGTLRVGKDVEPGTYVTKGNTETQFCNWERDDKSGEPIDLGVVTGQAVVTIKASDAVFKTNGCNDWQHE